MNWKGSSLVAVACALLIAVTVEGSAKRFDMSSEVATNSEGEIELEGWLDFGRPADTSHHVTPGLTNGMFWLGARLGLLDSLELASFRVLEKKSFVALQPPPMTDANGMTIPLRDSAGNLVISEDQSGIMMWLTDLKWRPVEVGKWPVDLFFQFQVVHWFEQYHPTQFRLTLGFSKTVGRFTGVLNASYWDSVVFASRDGNPNGSRWAWWEFSLGGSVKLLEADGWVPTVSLGVEAWGFVPRGSGTRLHVHNHLLHGGGFVLGPTLSLARGRLWLTGHLGFPVATPNIDAATNRASFGPSLPLVARIILGMDL